MKVDEKLDAGPIIMKKSFEITSNDNLEAIYNKMLLHGKKLLKKTIIDILNENNYNLEDCIIVIRTMLAKSKRLLKLFQEIKISNNIDSAISSIKPPIFWKDKQIVKDQINKWSHKNIELLIFRINEIELLIKKNSSISLSVLSDFIIEQASTASN